MEDTQKTVKIKKVKTQKTLKNRLKKLLRKAFGVERIDHIAIMIAGVLLFGLLVGYYITM